MLPPAFELHAFRFRFTARDAVHFPAGKSGNILRGAFGTLFRQVACVPECHDARTCPRRAECAYARLFEPSAAGAGPSGLADWPRPFVFRAAHLEGRTCRPGELFHFDVHVFDVRDPAAQFFVLAFSRLAEAGLGPGRARAQLTDAVQLDAAGCTASGIDGPLAPPIRIALTPGARDIHRLRVRFLTPTELKSGDGLAERPEFGALFSRARDRVSTLRALYGAGPLEIDFRAMGERAAAVRLTRCELARVRVERRSSRTGQTHPIGGFTGEAEYEGSLAEFVPYLEAARWTGVGRQTVWGKGAIECAVLDPRGTTMI